MWIFRKKVAGSPSHKKARDKARIALGTPNLFSKSLHITQTYRAEVHQRGCVSTGTHVVVCFDHNSALPRLIARVEGREVAVFISPSDALLEGVRESSGEALGHVVQVSDRTSIVEICVS